MPKGNICIEELEEALSVDMYEKHIMHIEELSSNRDWYVRAKLAILLGNYQNKHAEATLLSLLNDKSYLVQVEAINSLEAFPTEQVNAAVLSHISSNHPLVRGYVYRCICEMAYGKRAQQARSCLYNVRERNTWARIMLRISLLQLGELDEIHSLIQTFSRCNYLNKIAILNGFADTVSKLGPRGKQEIKNFMNVIPANNNEASVQEAVNHLKKVLMENL